MPIAVNPSDGSTVFLDADGAWKPAQTAVNPQTKEMLAFDGNDWAKVPAQSKGVLGYIDDAVRSVANGMTFGFADKMAAGANAALGNGSYGENVAQEQARTAQVPAGIRIPGEIGGAVASTIAAAPVTAPIAAASGLAKLPGIVKAMGAGGATGAAFGAGGAPSGEELPGAAVGTGVGMLGGAALYPIVRGVAAGVRGIAGAWQPEKNVASDLSRALQRDETTPEQLLQRGQELDALRPGVATLADAGGENVKGLVERIAQTPGAGRTTVTPALTDRQKQQLSRLTMDLGQLTGTRESAWKATEDAIAERAANAAPLYQAAHEAGDKVIWGPELETLTSSPTVRSAMSQAVRRWRDNVVADGYGGMNPGAMVENGGQLSFLSGKVPVFPNLQFWDYTKRAIDQRIEAAIDAGRNSEARDLTKIATKLRGALDEQVPEYAAARAAWGGPSEYMGAIKEGSKIFDANLTGEQLSSMLSKMTDPQREGYVIGAVSAIRGRMGNDPAKMADYTKYLRSPNMREKIAALMSPEDAQTFNNRLNFEDSLSELTRRSLGGSQTARRLGENEDASAIAGELARDAVMHGARGAALNFVTSVPGRVRDTLRSRSDAILADLLTQPVSVAGPRLQPALAPANRSPGLPSSAIDAAAINGTNSQAVPYFRGR